MRAPSGLVLNAMPSPLDAQSFVEKPLQEGSEAFAKVPIRHMGVFTHSRSLFQSCGLWTRREVPMKVGPMIVCSRECEKHRGCTFLIEDGLELPTLSAPILIPTSEVSAKTVHLIQKMVRLGTP